METKCRDCQAYTSGKLYCNICELKKELRNELKIAETDKVVTDFTSKILNVFNSKVNNIDDEIENVFIAIGVESGKSEIFHGIFERLKNTGKIVQKTEEIYLKYLRNVFPFSFKDDLFNFEFYSFQTFEKVNVEDFNSFKKIQFFKTADRYYSDLLGFPDNNNLKLFDYENNEQLISFRFPNSYIYLDVIPFLFYSSLKSNYFSNVGLNKINECAIKKIQEIDLKINNLDESIISLKLKLNNSAEEISKQKVPESKNKSLAYVFVFVLFALFMIVSTEDYKFFVGPFFLVISLFVIKNSREKETVEKETTTDENKKMNKELEDKIVYLISLRKIFVYIKRSSPLVHFNGKEKETDFHPKWTDKNTHLFYGD
jgi:hypothetical protein